MTDDKTTQATPKKKQIIYDSNPFTISIEGFSRILKHASSLFILIVILGAIAFILNIVQAFIDIGSEQSATLDSSSAATSAEITALAILVLSSLAIGFIIALVINVVFRGTIAAGTRAAIQKQDITIKQAASTMWQNFGRLFFAMGLSWIRIGAGYLLIVPGVRAQFRYEALPFVVLDNPDMTATEAANETRHIYKDHLIEAAGIIIFGSLIPIVGPIFSHGGICLSYQQIKAYKAAGLQKPEADAFNWILVAIVGGFYGFFLTIFLFIILTGIFA